MSHAQAPSAAATSGWRFQLRELLWLILLAALGLGWWRDNQQQATRAELYERQIAQLLHGQGPSVLDLEQVLRQYDGRIQSYRTSGTAMTPPTADEFVEIVAGGNQSAIEMALQSFCTSAHAHEAIPGLIPLLAHSGPGVRRMAVRSLVHIRGDSETAVPAIIPLLDDPDTRLNIDAILALRVRGEAARQAIPALTAKMNDSASPLAVQAAIALKDIDPETDLSKRLVELLQSPRSDVRAAAVLNLESQVGREEIERLLTAMYPGEPNETVRRAIANTLNRISRFAPASE